MADQFTLQPSKFTSLRSTRSRTSDAWADNWKQAQNEHHMLQGYHPDKLHRYRSLLEFSMSDATFANVNRLLAAELHVFRAPVNDHSTEMNTQKTTDTNLRVSVKKSPDWVEAGGGEANWSGALADDGAEPSDNYRSYAKVATTGTSEVVVNLLPLLKWWVPTWVKDKDGKAYGKNNPNYGMVLSVAGSDAEKHETVLASPQHANVGLRPFLVITYEPKGGPGTVSTSAPNGDIASGIPQFFEGAYFPGRPGDAMSYVEVVGKEAGKPDRPCPKYYPNSNEVATSTFAVPVPVSWPLLTNFTWVARVINSKKEPTPYSAALAVRWTGTPPTLSEAAPDAETLDSLISVLFSVKATVPAQQYRAARWRIQLRTQIVSTDPTWGDSVLWDTGPMTVPLSAQERGPVTGTVVQNLSLPYGGPALAPGSYSWRVQAEDVFGALSPWTYAEVEVTAPYVAQPGDAVNLTGYAKTPPHRIRIFDMGARRAPGKLVAELTDAANVGASEYYNAAGEFYFTLPVTHPQVAVIEPYQVHYALEVHTGEGWRGKAYGLITDFDANEDEVVFYGTDYLGLLGRAVEERFDPNDAELPTDKGGAKYVKKTISFIIEDQLKQAYAKANSPVGFITVAHADIVTLAEQVTIYASFKQRLPFIAGLIESARAGTGKRTRLVCERNVDGTFRWRLLNDPGFNRPNLRMEYGGLVQGFRTIPFGNWGTAVNATGRTMLGTKVYSAAAVAPGVSEPIYGHWPSLAMYADLDDLADLQRRAKQAATRVAKVGKQMGLALRVGSLTIKDGWDICDSLPVSIERGVVNTAIDPETGKSRWGSGYWTIWGWAWTSYPDGHDQLTLSLAPREDSTPPDPDLIPSKPILIEWQVGYGVPSTWGAPPTMPVSRSLAPKTGTPVGADEPVIAANYMDLTTGCTYAIDADYESYELVACPADGGGGTTPDIVPPDKPVIKSATSASATQDDGTSITSILALVGYATPPVDLTDLDHFLMESTRFVQTADPTQPDWTLATQWGTVAEDTTGVLDTSIVQPSVHSSTTYHLRVYAVDRAGNRSPPSDVVDLVTATDTVGPPRPSGVVTTGGMSTIGVRWDAVEVEDYGYTEVQWREAAGPGAWVSARVAGTLMVVTGVTNDVTYDVRVRSVDTSGNTLKDDGTSVKVIDDDEAGWVGGADVTPTALPGNALVWDEAIIEDIFAGAIDADWIQTGTLKVGVGAGNADAIEVYNNAGQLVGRWSGQMDGGTPPSPIGIEVLNPAQPGYKLRITESSLVIYTGADTPNPVAVVSATPLGIDAASVTFGSARGGHNLIQNSSFELGAFAASVVTNQTWDVAADWNASRVGADTNVTTGAGALTMTAI